MIEDLVFDGEVVVGDDFSGRRVGQFTAVGSSFTGCSFAGVEIGRAGFGAGTVTSTYVGCRFDRAKIACGPGGYARFVDCSFRDVDLRDWLCLAVELVACSFSGRLRNVVLNGTVPPAKRRFAGRARNEIVDNDLADARLIDVGFRTGVDLSRQALPSGPEYLYVDHAAERLDRLKVALDGWPDPPSRSDGEALGRAIEFELQGGQQQLLLNPSTYSNLMPAAVREVFRFLEGR